MGPANRDLQIGSPEALVGLLKDFMAGRALRSLSTTNEASFQVAGEMVLTPPSARVGELRLVMDGSAPSGCGRFGFADIFFAPGGAPAAVLLELKYLSLTGLLSGRHKRWLRKPTYCDLENLALELSATEEGALEEFPYAYWSEGKLVFTTVGAIRRAALKQLQGYAKVLQMGDAAGTVAGSGVNDIRVKIRPGHDILHSFTLVAVGGSQLLWQSAGELQTEFSYICTAI